MGVHVGIGDSSGILGLPASITLPQFDPNLMLLGLGALGLAWLASSGKKRYAATSEQRAAKRKRIAGARMQVKAAKGKLRAARRSPGFFG